ncbi:polar amino acid transport system substrate-binding protein [Herbihabitans rhizosphaerae]|uniref:Polar amino acid transport system substrate-binding protein n=1 Tax=Herbihabitans rhizosphaerae TaxID=1872711 RepID=A0A4Q7KHT7_9PSEU|nr:ectoine/hydroxyectoine ABC transporter substrate-binding protein EhuB [Herbihabitans rhizosphaerae]RZS32438.1 polar amino acid transport system substrate-binding protein [Herbihabitans rhizosphaerae]
MTAGDWTRRDFFRFSAATGAVAIGGPALLSACSEVEGGGTLDQLKKDGKIKAGIAVESPYGYKDASGKETGEAAEVGRAVFKAMGIGNVEFSFEDFDSLIQGLNAKKFDVVMAGMNIKKERCENAAFSIPDYSALTAFLVKKGNPKGIRTYDDVKAKGAKLAVLSGAVEKGYATSSGVPEGQITTLPKQDDMLRSVIDGRVDCASLTDISLKDLVKNNPNSDVDVTEGFDPVISGKKIVSAGAFVFRKDSNELREAFNKELKTLHENGEWVKITAPFGFTAANLPKPDVTTDRLCSEG